MVVEADKAELMRLEAIGAKEAMTAENWWDEDPGVEQVDGLSETGTERLSLQFC